MTTNVRYTPWLLILLLTVAGTANAFDGKRTGFCLGFGAGLATIKSDEVGVPVHQTRTGFQTTLDVGAGITDQLLILFSGHFTVNSTTDPPYDKLIWGEPTLIVRYYFKPTAPSFYISGGPAVALGTGLLISEEMFGAGALGVTAGAGYQYSRKLQLQIGAVRTQGNATIFTSLHATANLALF
jgi:hypothetical protein